jgi:phage-related protein
VSDWKIVFYEAENPVRPEDKPIELFLDSLPDKAAAKCTAYMQILAEKGLQLGFPYVSHVRGEIWELRPVYRSYKYRIFYFAHTGRCFVMLHAVGPKKRMKTDPRDIAMAEERLADYVRRHAGDESG